MKTATRQNLLFVYCLFIVMEMEFNINYLANLPAYFEIYYFTHSLCCRLEPTEEIINDSRLYWVNNLHIIS